MRHEFPARFFSQVSVETCSFRSSAGSRGAFTLLELVTVVCVLVVLSLLAGSGLARTKPGIRSAQCLSNTRAMMCAWQLYARDYGEKMVVAVHGGAAMGGAGDATWGVGWVSGWLDWTTASDNTNTLLLVDPRYARFANYLRDARTYKCPSDNTLSSSQKAQGWTQRCRSYSENIYIGVGNWTQGPTDPLYKSIERTSDFMYPSPAEAWVFIQEHSDSINDAAFWAPHQTRWINVPAPFHNGSTPLAFADGHSEMHRWEASASQGRATQVLYNDSTIGISAPSGDPDIHWLSYHSVRVSANSY